MSVLLSGDNQPDPIVGHSAVALEFSCPHCRKPLTADAEHAGAAIRCAACGQRVTIPRPPAVEEEPEKLKLSVGRGADGEVDMTPMIDCVFLLLIFFLVTAAFALQKSKELPAPEQEKSTQARTVEEIESDDDYIIVRIDQNSDIWMESSQIPSQQDLLIKLREALEKPRSQGKRSPTNLLVLANGDAVLEVVVSVLDAGTAVGIEHVRLAQNDEEF
jgi:biopolymer transport protein ExbD